ncbi:MAG: CoA transferase [Pseudomonadales bacterium]|nr:CoA transferase [Pseudomonadales bacterium]
MIPTASEIAKQTWLASGMPATALSRLILPVSEPALPSSFGVSEAVQATIGCAALAATEVGAARGLPAQAVSVEMADAERECTGYFMLDGKVPDAWAPLSGLYPCADGFVRIHANFEHHRDGVLRLLGLDADPASVTKDDVTASLGAWRAVDFETRAADAGMVVSALRTFDEWDALPQSAAVLSAPLVSIEKIGEAPPRNFTGSAAGGPLEGIRVLDLTRILAGPVAGRTLAAYGADVMLVNSPRLPNIEHIVDTSRGKRSCLVDLDVAEGVARLDELARNARVFVQGYRPGGLDARGFSAAALSERVPGLVYVSLSAYGPNGPWSSRRGFDSLVQTATGFNHAEGEAAGAGQPRALPIQALDYASGFLMAYGACVALHRQSTLGGSYHVRVSLARTAAWLRRLGRRPFPAGRSDLQLESHAEDYPSGFGALRAIPHAAKLGGTRAHWRRPSSPPGTDAPQW